MNLSRFFADKVVVITGSSRGIGREVARQALAAGAKVVLNGRDALSVEATRQELGALDRTLAVGADVSVPADAQRLAATVIAAWGRIDMLINNAGLSMRGAFADLSPITVQTMIDANFLSAVWATQAALPALRQSHGRVLFVSSLAGVRGFPGVSLYSASKMALAALHQSLRAEEGPRGVRSCLVYLAFTENDPGKVVLGADGRPFRHERRWSMSQTAAAAALLRATARGRPVVILTLVGIGFMLINRLLPALTDYLIRTSGGAIHSVRR